MATTKKATKKPTKAKATTAATKRSTAKKVSAATKKATTAKKKPAAKSGNKPVTVDRRVAADRRTTAERRKKKVPVAEERRVIERRVKVNRRRQIDPTTCERDYTDDEIEFMSAFDEYKRHSGRMFPTCSEILEVVKKLGYEKRPVAACAAQPSVELSAEQMQESTAV